MIMINTQIAIFEEKKVRKLWFQDQRWFSVIDVINILTWSDRPRKYRSDLKAKLKSEWSEVSVKIGQLKMVAEDGKMRETDCANTESLLRIIQSIPSPKAEPFKQRLAKVWYERIQEIENPELAQERMKQLYEQKGYPKDWIDKRVRWIAVRQSLTDEWKERWISKNTDFAILTAEISKATFGMTPKEYRKYKWLDKKNQNLRDHMTDLELIFSMLGERVTTEISQNEKPESFDQNKKVARRGWNVAGVARKETEKELKKNVISKDNISPWLT